MISKETLARIETDVKEYIYIGDETILQLITAARELEAERKRCEQWYQNVKIVEEELESVKAELKELRELKVDESGNDTLIDTKQRVGYATVLFDDIIPVGRFPKTLGAAIDAVNKITRHAPSSLSIDPTTTAPDSKPKA